MTFFSRPYWLEQHALKPWAHPYPLPPTPPSIRPPQAPVVVANTDWPCGCSPCGTAAGRRPHLGAQRGMFGALADAVADAALAVHEKAPRAVVERLISRVFQDATGYLEYRARFAGSAPPAGVAASWPSVVSLVAKADNLIHDTPSPASFRVADHAAAIARDWAQRSVRLP